MANEPLSPELALVDPELGARARAALDVPASAARARASTAAMPAPIAATPAHHAHHYPAWARVTAALWLLVLGILIGGAAIPHAQDRPRLIPKDDDPTMTVCRPATPAAPTPPPAYPHGRQGGI